MKLVLTCEHAGNEIPAAYENVFTEAQEILSSHRGFDPGSFDLYNDLKTLADFSNFQKVSRLLVEMNRSLHHPNLFSEYTKDLSSGEKKVTLEEYYFPYRDLVEKNIGYYVKEGEKVLHLSVHSFTPELNGEVRNADIGLLYDSSRAAEKGFCGAFKNRLFHEDQTFRVRLNYPYLGKADGFTTYLRKKFLKNYSGIELEVNQKFVDQNRMEPVLKKKIFNVLKEYLEAEG